MFAIFAFPLNWIPLLGSFMYLACMSLPLMMNFLTYVTERRVWRFRQLFGFVWKHRAECSGLGVMSFIAMIPFGLSIITLPVAVTASALLFIEKNNPLIISVNYVPNDIKVDLVFLTKSKRYTQLLNEMQESVNGEADVIATSNVTKTNGKFRYVLNYSSLIDPHTDIIDNSLVMLLKAMMELSVNSVYLAGFDGYSKRSDNYFDTKREYSFAKEKAKYLNEYVIEFLTSVKDKIQVQFITRSYYDIKKGES